MNRGAIAEIDLNALSNNLKVIRKLSNNSPVIAVVKADAYGHGAIEVSRRLLCDGIEYLAVAFTEEAKELREAGINCPILVLFDTDIDDVFRYNLIPVIHNRKTAALLSGEAEKNNCSIEVHIKIDTGMGRLGFRENAVKEIREIANLKGITIRGIISHFSEADLMDTSFAKVQVERFNSIKSELLTTNLIDSHKVLFHMANSAAIMTLPESHFDAVRPGLMLYGYMPYMSQELKTLNSELIPVMTVKTKILALRRLPPGTPISYGRTFITKRSSLIGVISIGYADGFNRRFSNNAEVLVAGKRAPVVGRVCMDLTMIDLTDVGDVNEGDEVVIIGRQGNEFINAVDLASKANTIPYEILTSLGNMAKRIYNN